MLHTRRIRVFVSSTFSDMKGEREALLSQVWPVIRRFCRERHIEITEVDLRWGVSEEQTKTRETLKHCLNEITACRPFFIGLLGERYGWRPDADAFTRDLYEEHPWLKGLTGRSITELEILHGVLNKPELAQRAFFYFRDPRYARARGAEFRSHNLADTAMLRELKSRIRKASARGPISLREGYADPGALAQLAIADLQTAIRVHFPDDVPPDPLGREASDHEAFAEVRRHTYIGRNSYFKRLDDHAAGDHEPLVVLGASGGGKSTLLANWIEHWRGGHPQDFVVQHYIGSTPDSAVHYQLIARVIGEIQRWTGDRDEAPTANDQLVRDFGLWLMKARAHAERTGVRCILVFDALNQLAGQDGALQLGWLPDLPFQGALRLVVSTLPGDSFSAVRKRGWASLRVHPLTVNERRRMIGEYLRRYGKRLDRKRLDRISRAAASANPLYIKTLLDELRVTGTHEALDERLHDYLAARGIESLLARVLARWSRDYERERPGLVGEALGLIWAARRGLSESELLRLLRPADLPQLPAAVWSPLRAALDEVLVDRWGVLNFSHAYFRGAVEAAYAATPARQRKLRLQLADEFEEESANARSCDELPWLLWQTKSHRRLRSCLLDIDRFLLILDRDADELRQYWVGLEGDGPAGQAYLRAFRKWEPGAGPDPNRVGYAAHQLGYFLHESAAYEEAEILMRRALSVDEKRLGKRDAEIATELNNLALLMQTTNRFGEAEKVLQRALAIDEALFGEEHLAVARDVNNLAENLEYVGQLEEAEVLLRRALAIFEKVQGRHHPDVASALNNLGELLHEMGRRDEALPLFERALRIEEDRFGAEDPHVATVLNNLGRLREAMGQKREAARLYRRALSMFEKSSGPNHPNVARTLNNLASLLYASGSKKAAERLFRQAIRVLERSYGPNHTAVASAISNLGVLLKKEQQFVEAEIMARRALEIDEATYGLEHSAVALDLNNLSMVLRATGRLKEAQSMARRSLAILVNATLATGNKHSNLEAGVGNYVDLLKQMGASEKKIKGELDKLFKGSGQVAATRTREIRIQQNL